MNNKLQHWASIELGYFTGSKDSTRFIHIYVLFSFAPLLYFSFGKLVFRWNPSSSTDLNVEARLRKHCDRGFCCRGVVVCRIRRRYFSIASFDGIFQVYVNKILCTRAFLVLLCVRACIQYYSMHNSIYKGGLKCTCENLRFYDFYFAAE